MVTDSLFGAVPALTELLELEHVCFLHPKPLRDLPRPHRLLATIFLVHAELIKTILRYLGLDVLSLALTIFPVLLEDRQEIGHGTVLHSGCGDVGR